VQFTEDVRRCALVATLELTALGGGDAGQIAVKETGDVTHVVDGGPVDTWITVAVQTRASDGAPADRPFHVAAIC